MIAATANPAAPRSVFVDLHAHSTASDGSRTPSEVVAAAKAAGVSAIALTDHDTMAGVPEAVAAGVALGIRVVPGVELSAVDDDREVHLLALHVATPQAIDAALSDFRDSRRDRAEQIVAKLNALGVNITFDEVLARAGAAAIGRPHLARVLVAEGWARDSRDAFDRYLGAGKPAYVAKQRLTVPDAIELAHAAGALAVLAHPGGEGRRDLIERYVAAGLDGVEVRHPGHSSEDVARLGALVDFFRLVPSGGSDWHGGTEGPRVLGAMRIPFEWLERQDQRVAERRASASAARGNS